MNWPHLVCFITLSTLKCIANDLKGFEDTVLFDFNWPANNTVDLNFNSIEDTIITTYNKGKHKCVPVLELFSPLFTRAFCSYRLESYWTYEVCHGRFIRKYHEDRKGNDVQMQEYSLGKWDNQLLEKIQTDPEEAEKDPNIQIRMKKINNVDLPYVEILMGNGSRCDFDANKSRETKVLYVCYIHGFNEVHSLKEVSTCQYEIIILSPLVCVYSKYKPNEGNEDYCVPINDNLIKNNYLRTSASILYRAGFLLPIITGVALWTHKSFLLENNTCHIFK